MGTGVRRKPERLAEKLRQIREALGFSQGELVRRLDLENIIEAKRISDYELGKNEPPLMVLLRYARLAGVNMELLADDELDLPDKLPGTVNHEAMRRAFTSRRKRK